MAELTYTKAGDYCEVLGAAEGMKKDKTSWAMSLSQSAAFCEG